MGLNNSLDWMPADCHRSCWKMNIITAEGLCSMPVLVKLACQVVVCTGIVGVTLSKRTSKHQRRKCKPYKLGGSCKMHGEC
jgi:hypothetical protein